jgi:hypothetical protein
MPTYADMVGRARKLHEKLGETKFRELYGNRPSSLLDDIDANIRVARSSRGSNVLQAFHFYPLSPSRQEIFEEIVRSYGEKPLLSKALTKKDSTALYVLEARGLIKLKRMKVSQGPRAWVVSEVFHNGAWGKAVLPEAVE